MKKIPCGIEDFKELISDYYYIDKSLFIKDVWDEKLTLYTRPRRFGKTLNMSMLAYFFSIKERTNSDLFQNLNITNFPEVMKHQTMI